MTESMAGPDGGETRTMTEAAAPDAVRRSDPPAVPPAGASPAELVAHARAIGIAPADLPVAVPHPERRLPLEGGLNFRDLGGYPTTDGGRTRWGVLFRSDHLNSLTDADVTYVTNLGLRRVHDFRLPMERERQPSRLPDGLEVHHLAAVDLGVDETMVDIVMDILAGRKPLPGPTFWDENYEKMVIGARDMFCRLVTSLTEPDVMATPSLFHCTGGKDRTGIAGVLVLELAGVDRATAIDDFLLTNVYRTPDRLAAIRSQLDQVGIPVAGALPIIGVTRSAVEHALHVIDTRYGGVESYLTGGGVDPGARDRLRTLLVES